MSIWSARALADFRRELLEPFTVPRGEGRGERGGQRQSGQVDGREPHHRLSSYNTTPSVEQLSLNASSAGEGEKHEGFRLKDALTIKAHRRDDQERPCGSPC